MNNFNKRAVFAALMGVLSSVSSFAMERTKRPRSRNIDNAQLNQSSQIRFLRQDDSDLEDIFTQIAKIRYENFGRGYCENELGLTILFNKERKLENLEKFREAKKINDTQWWRHKSLTTRHPNYVPGNMMKKYNDEISIDSGIDLGKFRDDEWKVKKYLIYLSPLGYVDGFIQYQDWSDGVFNIDYLAVTQQKTGTGIAGYMLSKLQEKGQYISLLAVGQSQAFYERYGFKYENQEMTWKKKPKKN